MGFAWSLFVAQSYMVGCCGEAGFQPTGLLTEGGTLPSMYGNIVSVATGDVLHFRRATKESMAVNVATPLACLDTVWDQ